MVKGLLAMPLVTAEDAAAIATDMDEEKRAGQFGGGVFLAIGPFIGLAAGAALGQPSIGLLGGIAAGIILAVIIWIATR